MVFMVLQFFFARFGKKDEVVGEENVHETWPPLKVFIPTQFLRSTSYWIRCARYSMQRMKMYDESGSPCLISLEGGKG